MLILEIAAGVFLTIVFIAILPWILIGLSYVLEVIMGILRY